jgi:hypothetical protein
MRWSIHYPRRTRFNLYHCLGINDYGQIVGNYVDSENKTRASFATPTP